MTTITRMPGTSARSSSSVVNVRDPSQVLPSPSFWETIHKIRTKSFEYNDHHHHQQQQQQQHQKQQKDRSRKWIFRSLKSHILDTNGHYAWKRELNCFQGQSLPDAVFPHNTLEIIMTTTTKNTSTGDGDSNGDCCLRIRFGALEGLRGWMSLDSEPIPTIHARDSAHWKNIASQQQQQQLLLPRTNNNSNNLLGGSDGIISSTSYDYAYTTPYKGGTDVFGPSKDDTLYDYLEADSTSFAPKHDSAVSDLPVAGGSGIQRIKVKTKVKLRKPICKCKGDGGRAPLVSSKSNDRKPTKSMPHASTSTSTSRIRKAPNRQLPSPHWTSPDLGLAYRVDIEGMLRRAAAAAAPKLPFLFREDVDLWQDDLHDNGTAWLKARCFVCQEGWACLLRNFVRVDGVVCRVIDTRYIHTFGSSRVYREHSWREGPWDDLVRDIRRHGGGGGGPATTTHPSQQRASQRLSPEPINDSIAARYLPLRQPPLTEYLSLEEPSVTPVSTVDHVGKQQHHQHQRQHLVLINDSAIEDAIPVPNSEVERVAGISFVLKRSNGTCLEALSSSSTGEENADSRSVPISSLWSKAYNTGNTVTTTRTRTQATILSVQISPDPTDGGRLAIGDDRGKVCVWRLSTGESLWGFPVAPSVILNRLNSNPYFESARLWVDHIAWSGDGSLVGASAGRNTVLAAEVALSSPKASNEKVVLAALESTSGTVTGLAFRKRPGRTWALAVASYGEIRWLTAPLLPRNNQDDDGESKGGDVLETLQREGAAVECIDISSNGKRIAVGFLDKTLRVFTMDTEPRSISTGHASAPLANTSSSFAPALSKDGAVVDWVGFSTAVKSVRFDTNGHWLAAMGGSAVLVIRGTLSPRTEAPIVCRTPGRTEPDGGDGTCHRFEGISWSSSSSGGGSNATESSLLAALDANTKSVHVFRICDDGSSPSDNRRNQDDTWPVRALPVITVSPSFVHPSPFGTTRFAFFSNHASSEPNQGEDNDLSFIVLDRSLAAANDNNYSALELDSMIHKPSIDNPHAATPGNSTRLRDGGDVTIDERFSFRTIL